MQENRSFDHYFGTLQGCARLRRPERDHAAGGYSGLQPAERRGPPVPVEAERHARRPAAPTARRRPVQRRSAAQLASTSTPPGTGPPRQLGARRRATSARSATSTARTSRSTTRSPTPTRSATPTTAPCSARPAPTAPTCGAARSTPAQGGSPAYDGGDESGLDLGDLREALQSAGVSWKVYQNARRTTTATTASRTSSSYGDGRPADVPVRRAAWRRRPPRLDRHRRQGDDIAAAIKADVLAGTLPQVSWVVADRGLLRAPVRRRPATARTSSHGYSRRSTADPEVPTRPSCSTTTRTTASSTTSPPPVAGPARHDARHRVTSERRRRSASASACRCS